jgi:hypothetical protein
MSRFYEMSITISAKEAKITKQERVAVETAVEELWDWECEEHDGIIHATGQEYLNAGETEDHFARRCYQAVWNAVKRYVDVGVNATYLEDLPCESYESSVEDFNKIMQ